MPSDEFSRCIQSAFKLPADELLTAYTVIGEFLKTKGIISITQMEQVDFQDLVKKSMDLLNSRMDLMGWEMALLAGMILQHGNFSNLAVPAETFDSRAITGELRRYSNRVIANITSVMDTLKERGLVEETDQAREKGAHRSYRVNSKGQSEVTRLWKRFETQSNAA